MTRGVLGPPLGGEVLGLEAEAIERIADVARAVLVVLAGRIHRRNPDHPRRERHDFVGGAVNFAQDAVDQGSGGHGGQIVLCHHMSPTASAMRGAGAWTQEDM